MAGLVASLDSATVYINGTRYPITAQALTLADNATTLVVATSTGYAQVFPAVVPLPGTAAIIALFVTSGGSIVKWYDVRQYGGVTGNNAVPPASGLPAITSVSIVPFVEGVGTIGVNLSITFTTPFDKTIQSAGFTYALKDTGLWHQFSAAVTDANNVQTFTGTIHGLDPDQALDFAFQAVGVDNTPVPANPYLIGSIAAQSVPTPISKVIVPRGTPGYDPTNPFMPAIIQRRHFQGSDGSDTGPLMGEDGFADNIFDHGVMSWGAQVLSDMNGNVNSSASFSKIPVFALAGVNVGCGFVCSTNACKIWATDLTGSSTPAWTMTDGVTQIAFSGTGTSSGSPIINLTGLAGGWQLWPVIWFDPVGLAINYTLYGTGQSQTTEPTSLQKSQAFKDGMLPIYCPALTAGSTAFTTAKGTGTGGFSGGGRVPSGL